MSFGPPIWRLRRPSGQSRRPIATARADAIVAWVREHGTPNQQARRAAGVLPDHEVVSAMAAAAFAGVTIDWYCPITRTECSAALAAAGVDDIPDGDPTCSVREAETLTAEQWEALEAVRTALPPEAVCRVRRVQCGLYDDVRDTDVVRHQNPRQGAPRPDRRRAGLRVPRGTMTGADLKCRRLVAGETQTQFAARLGVTPNTIARWSVARCASSAVTGSPVYSIGAARGRQGGTSTGVADDLSLPRSSPAGRTGASPGLPL